MILDDNLLDQFFTALRDVIEADDTWVEKRNKLITDAERRGTREESDLIELISWFEPNREYPLP